MPRRVEIERGEDYLPEYSIEDLEHMMSQLPYGKPRLRVKAAIHRKNGYGMSEISDMVGAHRNTVRGWLVNMANGGMCRIYDTPSPGRPRKLTDDEIYQLELTIRNGPQICGYDGGVWTAKNLVKHIQERFGKTYSVSGLLKLVSRLGYSVRKPRPIPHNSATPQEQKKFKEEAYQEQTEYRKKGYTICCFDACAKTNSPTAKRGIRVRGGTDTVRTNHSKKSIQMLGILADQTLDIIFSNSYKSDDTIRMLEHARKKYKKIYCIMDNAGANRSIAVKDHVANSGRDIVIKYTLPHTPQLNPIELQWSCVKGCVDGIYFESFEAMQQYIKNALESGQIPVVKLQKYLSGSDARKGPPSVEVVCIDKS